GVPPASFGGGAVEQPASNAATAPAVHFVIIRTARSRLLFGLQLTARPVVASQSTRKRQVTVNPPACCQSCRGSYLPACALIFHVVGDLLRDLGSVIPLNHVQRGVHAGSQAAGSDELAIVDEASASLQIHLWKLRCEHFEEIVMGRGIQAIQ